MNRQPYPEACPFTRLTVYIYMPMMTFNDAVDKCDVEPRTRTMAYSLGGKKRVKNTLYMLWFNTFASISNLNPYLFTL